MKIYGNKGDIVRDVILTSKRELTYREILEIVRRSHHMAVTWQYVRLVIKELEKQGKVEVTYRLTPDPNQVRMFVKPKGRLNDEVCLP